MNKFKGTSAAHGQGSTKSSDKLISKHTHSSYLNNNVVDMTRKPSTTNANGRPETASPGKGKSSSKDHSVNPARNSTTPSKHVRTSSPPFGGGGVSHSPQRTSNNSPQQKPGRQAPPATSPSRGLGQQQSPKNNNQTGAHNSSDQTKSSGGFPLVRALSTSSVKSNSGNQQQQQRPKTSTPQNQQKPSPSTTNANVSSNATTNSASKPMTLSQTTVFQRQSTTKALSLPIPRNPSNLSRSMVSLERSRNFRAFIEKAMNDHKIFACCGVYPAIRNALKKRGWVEKPGPLAYSRSTNLALSNNVKGPEDESDVAWMTRVLKDYSPDFIWVIRRDNIDWKLLAKEQLINRFPKAWFTTKVGLAACLQHMHWFSEAGVSDTFFPRCYRLCLEEERQAFQDDYRLTACMSYLRYFVETFETKGHTALADVHSKITPLSVDFASRQLGNYVRMRRHEDIDWLLPPNFMTQHWDAFIHQYYAIVHERKRLRFDSPEAVHVKYEIAKKTLHKVSQYWPQIELDGKFNMWICKPGARSRGKGIVIMNTLEKIMDLLSQNNFRESNWVVQKYIERPMLIYKTKFDIRQWFLITDWTPLTVWFYKESYVRFCTKPFVLEDFHESIHLCNNAIQCRYQNSDQRDSNLPDENMWSSDTFQAYLKTIGRLDAWPLVYSGMKQAIVGVLLASQETVESRRGCFELYGADFMLTEDFRPWLIEINSCPCMAASTSVTARMCAQCLEDTVKVVVDKRNNRNAGTGMFEMIYRQNAGSVVVQQFSGHDLTIIGKKLNRDIEWPMTMAKSITTVNSRKSSHALAAHQSSGGGGNRQTLSELLQKLRVRNQEMFQGKSATQAEAQEDPNAQSGANAAALLLSKMKAIKSMADSDENANGQGGPNKAPAAEEKVPAATGKGEDPSSISSKFADMNSLAYLVRNSAIPKDGEPSGETKGKRQEERKASPAPGQQPQTKPGPKTWAEVKALVESTRPPSEKHGKPCENTHFTNIAQENGCESGESESDLVHITNYSCCDTASTHSAFDNHSDKKPTDNFKCGEGSPDTGADGTARPVENPTLTLDLPITVQPTNENVSAEVKVDPTTTAIHPQKTSSGLKLTIPMSSGVSRRIESYTQLTRKNPSRMSLASNISVESLSHMVFPEPAHDNHAEHTPIAEASPPKETKPPSSGSENDPPLIDFVTSDTEVKERLKEAKIRAQTNGTVEADDPQGKLYQSILFPCSSSSSESDNDEFNANDDNNNDINLASLLITPPYRQADIGHVANPVPIRQSEPFNRQKSLRLNQRRNTVPVHRRCSRRYPCYRVMLESEFIQRSKSKRRMGATLPMKTINLLLPPDCPNYF